MTPADIPLPRGDLWVVAAGLLAIAGSVLGLRLRKSSDDTKIARNTAEAGIYSQALAAMTAERDGWRDAFRKSEEARIDLHALNAGLMARQELQDQAVLEMRTRHLAELKAQQRQITILREMIGRIADPETRRILGREFARSQSGGLDELPEESA